MKVAIIGAGFTGLTAAYELLKEGHEVTVFERDSQPGGLAVGYQEKKWDWTMEKHYHHWFTNDTFVLDLAKEIGHDVIIKRPKTSVYINGNIYQLDSPKAFLTLPVISFVDRFRMIFALGILRIDPFWQPLEKVRAVSILPKVMGKKAWDTVWSPQLKNKMGKFADGISLAWFWTRINKRSPSLAYPAGGFLAFANSLAKEIEKRNGKIHFSTQTLHIESDGKAEVTFKKGDGKEEKEVFDKVIVTLSTFIFLQLAPHLPELYTKNLHRLQGLSATNLVLRLKNQFLHDGTYWLSICQKDSPVMGIFEHTNFMDRKYYNKEHLVYVGNYAMTDDKLQWDKKDILKFYDPFLQKIHPHYEKDIIGYQFFTAPFAQPIVPTNYSKMIPPFDTPLSNVYLANMQQVYPWDRGTNYAVELGQKITKYITTK